MTKIHTFVGAWWIRAGLAIDESVVWPRALCSQTHTVMQLDKSSIGYDAIPTR